MSWMCLRCSLPLQHWTNCTVITITELLCHHLKKQVLCATPEYLTSETGCPERWWDLHTWRYSTPDWTRPWKMWSNFEISYALSSNSFSALSFWHTFPWKLTCNFRQGASIFSGHKHLWLLGFIASQQKAHLTTQLSGNRTSLASHGASQCLEA